MKSILITNLCTKTRVKMKDGHVIQLFSGFYNHPAMVKEDWWHLLKVGSERVLVDEDTLVIMKDMECEWGYEAKTDIILTCKLTSKISDEDERMQQWNKLYAFSLKLRKDIESSFKKTTVDDLTDQLNKTSLKDSTCKDSGSVDNSATTENIPATRD